MGVADYGTAVQTTASPSLADWAAAVSAALDDDDTTVNARLLAGGVKFGYRITRPNTDDRLVEQWNGSAWSVVGYDSGWRDVTASLLNGWTGGSLRIRRTLNDVQVIGAALVAGTANDIYTLPTGFHPGVNIQVPFISLGSTQPQLWSADTAQSVGVTSGTNAATIRCLNTSAQSTHRFSVVLPVTGAGSAIPTSLPGTLVTAAPA